MILKFKYSQTVNGEPQLFEMAFDETKRVSDVIEILKQKFNVQKLSLLQGNAMLKPTWVIKDRVIPNQTLRIYFNRQSSQMAPPSALVEPRRRQYPLSP